MHQQSTTRHIFQLVGVLILISAAIYFGQPSQSTTGDDVAMWEAQGTAMGSQVQIKLFAKPHEAQAESDAAMAEIVAVDEIFSDFKEFSELSLANRTAATDTIALSAPFRGLLHTALEFSRKTGGAFDVTVGPLVDLWKKAGKEGQLPSESALVAARARTGYDKLSFDGDRLHFRTQGLRLDFGAIAQGYAVDRAIAVLRQRGHTCAIVNVSGDIFVLGDAPSGDTLTIGIQHPRNLETLICKVRVRDRAVVTSGDYQRFVEIGGKRYNHIIDPRTGWPVSEACSVTVIANDATTADALSTAVTVMGRVDGLALIESLEGVEALIVTANNDGRVDLWPSSGFHHYQVGGDGP